MKTKKPISPENALARAAALCSRCEKAESDIRNKLSSWGISPDDADNITQKLIENRFLDEVRFASAFARDKFNIEGWGRVKIAYQLRMKRISSEAIEEALSHIDENEYISILKTILKCYTWLICVYVNLDNIIIINYNNTIADSFKSISEVFNLKL